MSDMGDFDDTPKWATPGDIAPAMPRAAQEYLSEVDRLREQAGLRANLSDTRDPFVPFDPEPAQPTKPEELPAGTVLGFTKRYTENGTGYSFVAIRAGRLGWYLTGPNYAGEPIRWADLLDFIGGPDEWARVGVVTAWTPLVVR